MVVVVVGSTLVELCDTGLHSNYVHNLHLATLYFTSGSCGGRAYPGRLERGWYRLQPIGVGYIPGSAIPRDLRGGFETRGRVVSARELSEPANRGWVFGVSAFWRPRGPGAEKPLANIVEAR